MLRRVRYLDSLIVAILPNYNAHSKITNAAGKHCGLAAISKKTPTDYDRLYLQLEEKETTLKGHFAAALFEAMQHEGWKIVRHNNTVENEYSIFLPKEGKKIREQRREALLLLAPLNPSDAAKLTERIGELEQDEDYQLMGYQIRDALGLPWDATLADYHIDIYDKWGIKTLERYALLKGLDHQSEDIHNPASRVLSTYKKAIRQAYAYLFTGYDISDGSRFLTPDAAADILDRMIARRFELAALGIIPVKYGWYKAHDQADYVYPMKRPKYPVREVQAVLMLAGIRTKDHKTKVLKKAPKGGQMGINSFNTKSDLDTFSLASPQQYRVYSCVTDDHLEQMAITRLAAKTKQPEVKKSEPLFIPTPNPDYVPDPAERSEHKATAKRQGYKWQEDRLYSGYFSQIELYR
jgi:hypothetical protein